jgi:hypothetical protein
MRHNFEIKEHESRVNVSIRWEARSTGLLEFKNRDSQEVSTRGIGRYDWNTHWSLKLKKGGYSFSVYNIAGQISQIKLFTGKGAILYLISLIM